MGTTIGKGFATFYLGSTPVLGLVPALMWAFVLASGRKNGITMDIWNRCRPIWEESQICILRGEIHIIKRYLILVLVTMP